MEFLEYGLLLVLLLPATFSIGYLILTFVIYSKILSRLLLIYLLLVTGIFNLIVFFQAYKPKIPKNVFIEKSCNIVSTNKIPIFCNYTNYNIKILTNKEVYYVLHPAIVPLTLDFIKIVFVPGMIVFLLFLIGKLLIRKIKYPNRRYTPLIGASKEKYLGEFNGFKQKNDLLFHFILNNGIVYQTKDYDFDITDDDNNITKYRLINPEIISDSKKRKITNKYYLNSVYITSKDIVSLEMYRNPSFRKRDLKKPRNFISYYFRKKHLMRLLKSKKK